MKQYFFAFAVTFSGGASGQSQWPGIVPRCNVSFWSSTRAYLAQRIEYLMCDQIH